jgi:GNAT superfamily N-acetyltransferase
VTPITAPTEGSGDIVDAQTPRRGLHGAAQRRRLLIGRSTRGGVIGSVDRMDDLQRFLALETRRRAMLSTRQVPFDAGIASFDDDYPERYVSNLLVIADAGAIGSDDLIAAADSILGGAGLPHRFVTVLDDRGALLAPGLRDAGYEAGRIAGMVLRRTPDRPSDLDVEDRSFDEVRELTAEIYRRELPATPETVARFVEQHARWDRILGTRRFVVTIDGAAAGQCELYLIGPDALIEYVDTLQEYRGRGVARAAVLAAAEAAQRAGAERIFIGAEENDWPKVLYERLGFDPTGGLWEFMRRPSGA